MIKKLFEDEIGAGADREAGMNGAWVRLTYWTSEKTAYLFSYPSHYVIENKVMIDGQVILDTKEVFFENFSRDSLYIRKAIDFFDDNVKTFSIKELLRA